MTKENIIPFENKKPFETVQEVKNEVPSFEEFMKNYESDEGVINSYENEIASYGDIGVDKGYGPCSSSKCACYTWQGYVPLNTACLGCGSFNSDGSNNFSQPHQWVHAYNNCGSPIYISRYVYLKCMSCGIDGHWKEWSFRCERHTTFKSASTSSKVFITALSIAASMNPNDDRSIEIINEIVLQLLKDAREGR